MFRVIYPARFIIIIINEYLFRIKVSVKNVQYLQIYTKTVFLTCPD